MSNRFNVIVFFYFLLLINWITNIVPQQLQQVGCKECHFKTSKEIIDDETIESLRIEFVKKQILSKLRLTAPPLISSIPPPDIRYIGQLLAGTSKRIHSSKVEFYPFYAHHQQIILFPTNVEMGSKYLNLCFRPLTIDELQNIQYIELWLKRNNTAIILQENIQINLRLTVTVGVFESYQMSTKNVIWFRLKMWIGKHNFEPDAMLMIQVQLDASIDMKSLVDAKSDPFLVGKLKGRKPMRKRNVDCNRTSRDIITNGECCRDRLFINFTEIGWNDWIIYPPGYEAYFCRGSCDRVATVTLNKSLYISGMRKAKKFELIPCCAASKMSPLQLVYMATNGNDTQATAQSKLLPNMIVDICGCM